MASPTYTPIDYSSFLDFTGGAKPYLMDRVDNHTGAVIRVEYRSSTEYYLADQQRPARRWQTPLPFPVQVVARVEAIDAISRGKLTTEYSYSHGYWDGVEREFRAAGLVRLFAHLRERRLGERRVGQHAGERVGVGDLAPRVGVLLLRRVEVGEQLLRGRAVDRVGRERHHLRPHPRHRAAGVCARLH